MRNPKTAFALSFLLTVIFLSFLVLMAVASNDALEGQTAFNVSRTANGTSITMFNENLLISDSVTKPLKDLYGTGARFYSNLIPQYLKESGGYVMRGAANLYNSLPDYVAKALKK